TVNPGCAPVVLLYITLGEFPDCCAAATEAPVRTHHATPPAPAHTTTASNGKRMERKFFSVNRFCRGCYPASHSPASYVGPRTVGERSPQFACERFHPGCANNFPYFFLLTGKIT